MPPHIPTKAAHIYTCSLSFCTVHSGLTSRPGHHSLPRGWGCCNRSRFSGEITVCLGSAGPSPLADILQHLLAITALAEAAHVQPVKKSATISTPQHPGRLLACTWWAGVFIDFLHPKGAPAYLRRPTQPAESRGGAELGGKAMLSEM